MMSQVVKPAPGGYAAVLFDFDGTLADVAVDWDAVRRDLRDALRPVCPEIGPAGSVMAMMEAVKGLPGPRRLAAGVLARHESGALVSPRSQALAFFRRCAAEKAVGVVSNNLHETVRAGLSGLGLATDGLVIIGFDDVSASKPDPEGIGKAMSMLGIEPGNCVYVGDAPSDEQAAARAGVAFLDARDIAQGSLDG